MSIHKNIVKFISYSSSQFPFAFPQGCLLERYFYQEKDKMLSHDLVIFKSETINYQISR